MCRCVKVPAYLFEEGDLIVQCVPRTPEQDLGDPPWIALEVRRFSHDRIQITWFETASARCSYRILELAWDEYDVDMTASSIAGLRSPPQEDV